MRFTPAPPGWANPSTQPLTEPATQFDTVTASFGESLPVSGWFTDESSAGVVSTLSGTLQDDVARFLQTPEPTDLLPVLAASIRHSKALAMHLVIDAQPVRLVTLPRMQGFACDVQFFGLTDQQVRELRLQRVDEGSHANFDITGFRRGMIGDMVWRFALHGSRGQLLPEIAGPLAYRTVGRPEREALAVPGVHAILQRLSGPPVSLSELTRQTSDADLVRRVLNALYLRSSLIVTRACTPRTRHHASLWR